MRKTSVLFHCTTSFFKKIFPFLRYSFAKCFGSKYVVEVRISTTIVRKP